MKHIYTFTLLMVVFTCGMYSQTKQDSVAIMKTVANYNEGWYEGNITKMDNALHPELVKRFIDKDKTSGKDTVSTISKEIMMQYVKAGYGKNTPKENQNDKVTILGIYDNVACVKVDAFDLVDFLQLAKYKGEWKILNVLWALKKTTDLKK